MEIAANVYAELSLIYTGYIAGSGNGIVTVNGAAASRHIHLLDASSFDYIRHTVSLPNGHYIFNGIDPNQEYLVICRDHNKEYEPAVWDYVTPATDLTIAQQQELWQSWQTSS